MKTDTELLLLVTWGLSPHRGTIPSPPRDYPLLPTEEYPLSPPRNIPLSPPRDYPLSPPRTIPSPHRGISPSPHRGTISLSPPRDYSFLPTEDYPSPHRGTILFSLPRTIPLPTEDYPLPSPPRTDLVSELLIIILGSLLVRVACLGYCLDRLVVRVKRLVKVTIVEPLVVRVTTCRHTGT